MTKPSYRDLEKLSAYLDGELPAAESRRLESRLASDPGLRAALDDLKRTRAVLRRTPRRRAPRSFTLTPEMVAPRPPMPRAYPILRFASAVAALLLFASFASNFLALPASAPQMLEAPAGYNVGGAAEEEMPAGEPAAPEMLPAEAPATATEALSAPEAEAPALAAEPTFAPAAADNRGLETVVPTPTPAMPAEKAAPPLPQPGASTPAAPPAAPLTTWQIVLAALVVFFALGAFTVRRATLRKWQEKSK
ncbi:MAG: hypothetical protein GXP40_08515 [Chloroflexi bacterium]|nr:hypothetical protein [Chloroflexota bacterium]